MRIADYGSWESPLTAADLTRARVDLGGGTLDAGTLYWKQTRSEEGGRTSVWCRDGEAVRELTPGQWVRSTVHEYGGGDWAVGGGVLVYSTFQSHRVWALDVASGRRWPLTPEVLPLRYASFEVLPGLGLVVCVREDHTASDLDCVNTLVALELGEENPDGGRVLASGADFYAAPRVSRDGRLAWVEWDHPNMPWDSTRLMVGVLAGGAVEAPRQVAGSASSAPCHPEWRGDELVFLDDSSGFWNFYADAAGAVRRLNEEEADFCGPAWVLGSAYALLDDGRIACVRYTEGRGVPGLLQDGRFVPLAECADVGNASIGGDGHDLLVLLQHVERPATLELWDAARESWTPVVQAASPLAAEYVSVPRPVSWLGPQGGVHAFYYPPVNPGFAAPEGALPPLLVESHGGPTGAARPWFALARQYWTTRGWAVLDVNYGGSALFGRAYRERLRGGWGVVDVRDCTDGVRAMVEAGLADPAKVAIEGGSAGGFTTLAALTSSDAFAAGNCLFGIGDLGMLAAETHKFESRYLFGLVGGTPEEVPEVYADRSPINHLDRLSVPMLIQQGTEDRVVPPSQALAMASAVRGKGLPVALVMFEGEGHGFRRAENIQASVEAAASFFGQVFGFDVPGVPKLAIENLGARSGG